VYNFLLNIYGQDKSKMKSNIMFVNCAHGKGIKFIREELKFFAKSNIQFNCGVMFKSIVLLNADFLTIDAQSALRRCIELFSFNTRFFIIVENKNKLLNPILSRFCDIYIPETMTPKRTIVNLHQHCIHEKYLFDNLKIDRDNIFGSKIAALNEKHIKNSIITHKDLVLLATDLYNSGFSCLDLIHWFAVETKVETKESFTPLKIYNGTPLAKQSVPLEIQGQQLPINELSAIARGTPLSNLHRCNHCTMSDMDKSAIIIVFHKIKSEYRCEKLLMLYILDFAFLRQNKDLKNIGFM